MTSCHVDWRVQSRLETLKEIRILQSKGFRVRSMRPPFHYRIEGRLDVYTTGNRWHYLPLNTRGDFTRISETLHNLDVQPSGKFRIWEWIKAIFSGMPE